jgi:hypothetical protein
MKPKYIIELNRKLAELKEPSYIFNEKKDCLIISLTDDGRLRFALGYDGVEKKPNEQITFNPKASKEIFEAILDKLGEGD